jgi:DNA-binding transcriptional MerR regulator
LETFFKIIGILKRKTMAYTVQKLAKLSGVSVRTLHHYDEVGLLKPAYYGANGYRYYEEEQLLLLQQILFFRNLGFELQKIREIIKKSDFDRLAALHSHRKSLINNLDKTRELIQTIDNTIEHLQGKKKIKDKQFFDGLNSPKQKEYEKYIIEAGQCTAEEMERGRKKLEKWSKEDWQKNQANWEQLLNDYVSAIKKQEAPDSLAAQDLVRRHLEYLKKFGIEVKKEELVEKANFYLGHPDWRKVFDGYHPQLLEFILAAMESYARTV